VTHMVNRRDVADVMDEKIMWEKSVGCGGRELRKKRRIIC
jgi:hypothetical protein